MYCVCHDLPKRPPSPTSENYGLDRTAATNNNLETKETPLIYLV
jgi:hypothetical protein